MRRFSGFATECSFSQLISAANRLRRSARIRTRETKSFERRNRTFCRTAVELDVWMSHGDHVTALPEGFHRRRRRARSSRRSKKREKIYAVQFHPEVSHTPLGKEILRNFLSTSANAKAIGLQNNLSPKKSKKYVNRRRKRKCRLRL